MAGLLYGCIDVGGRKKRKERQFRHVAFTIEGYRFRRESIMHITDLLAEDLRRKTQRNHPISALQQVLIALRFYASGSFLQVIGDTIGVDKSTGSRVVTNVSLALVAKQQQYIKWPKDQQDFGKSKNSFYQRGKFPCVIGCVDGTHIRIQAPHENENGYVNRKGFHSTNVLGICNHEG
ncbi:putative nuclease HARBI1 [Acropora millepora]|uniref:putative nuclease HARBI1 n=1 Tax=Acropora millepora TaxID=45264 RepID=UPI001CF1101E|nr:putative nuclease HARBI1 [Acropora millepora]